MEITFNTWSEFKNSMVGRGAESSLTYELLEIGTDSERCILMWVDAFVKGTIILWKSNSEEDWGDFQNNYAPLGNSRISLRQENGAQVVKTQVSEEGSILWSQSANLCSQQKTGWFDPDNNIVCQWKASPGKKLLTKTTKLIASSDVDLSEKPVHFRGSKDGFTGSPSYWFNRIYETVWDYRVHSDHVYHFDWGCYMMWDYNGPGICMLSSQNGLIDLVLPNGPVTGTRFHIKLKFISISE